LRVMCSLQDRVRSGFRFMANDFELIESGAADMLIHRL